MGNNKVDKKHGIAIIYGGLLKQSTVRVEEVLNLDEFDKNEYTQAYGSAVKGYFIVANNKTHLKDFKKKLESHHQFQNLYTNVNVTDAKKWLKEIAGTEKASTIVFGNKAPPKAKKETPEPKKEDTKKPVAKKPAGKKKDESGSDSDSSSSSDSGSESDRDAKSDSGSSSDSDDESTKKTSKKVSKPAPKKGKGKS